MATKSTVTSQYGVADVKVYETEVPDSVGRFALSLIERWGMVSATTGDVSEEDSAGRQRLITLSPSEVVQRAFDMATLAFDALRDRGMMVQVHDLGDEIEKAKEKTKRRDRAEVEE